MGQLRQKIGRLGLERFLRPEEPSAARLPPSLFIGTVAAAWQIVLSVETAA